MIVSPTLQFSKYMLDPRGYKFGIPRYRFEIALIRGALLFVPLVDLVAISLSLEGTPVTLPHLPYLKLLRKQKETSRTVKEREEETGAAYSKGYGRTNGASCDLSVFFIHRALGILAATSPNKSTLNKRQQQPDLKKKREEESFHYLPLGVGYF